MSTICSCLPPGTGINPGPLFTNEKILYRIQTVKKMNLKDKLIIFIGSSSVLSGIDENIVRNIFNIKKIDKIPLNFGLLGMSAIELPFHKDCFLNKNVHLVVYLYNTFSFPRYLSISPEQANEIKAIRWNTFEFFRALYKNDLMFYVVPYRWYIISGIECELFKAIKFNNVLRYFIFNFLSTKKHDFIHDWHTANRIEPYIAQRPRIFEKIEQNDGLRQLYIESETDEATFGYNQLERFLYLAKEKGKKVVVAPFPEPEFALWNRRKGIKINKIDCHVQRIVESYNMIFLERNIFDNIEKNDSYYIDVVHMGKTGSEIYSKYLAKIIINYINS
ncbi:MAG: hypothetical protein NC935_03690 [Candidatus Omnitrophica bacterium]|nr:hypothetical protein [Candidatus Omnitrophota bacterium]